MRNRTGKLHSQFTEEIYNEALILIEDICLIMSNKILSQLGMPESNRPMHYAFNHELQREKLYNLHALRE